MPREIAPLVTSTTSVPNLCSSAACAQIDSSTASRVAPCSSVATFEPILMTTGMRVTLLLGRTHFCGETVDAVGAVDADPFEREWFALFTDALVDCCGALVAGVL